MEPTTESMPGRGPFFRASNRPYDASPASGPFSHPIPVRTDPTEESLFEDRHQYSPSAITERPELRRAGRRGRKSIGFGALIDPGGDEDMSVSPEQGEGFGGSGQVGRSPFEHSGGQQNNWDPTPQYEDDFEMGSPGDESTPVQRAGAYRQQGTVPFQEMSIKPDPVNSRQSREMEEMGYREDPDHRVGGDDASEAYAALLRPALRGEAEFSSVLGGLHDLAQGLADRRADMAAAQTRSIERHLLEQKARALQSEVATWSLVWHLLGKPFEEMLSAGLLPPTSQQEACEYALGDVRAQACMRVVQWLEDLAGQQVDREQARHGGYLNMLRHSNGVWVRTAQALKSGHPTPSNLVSAIDPDAPTRENAHLHPQDLEDEELLMRAVWTLLKAGRLSDARQLCRDVGQAWRAASLGGTGDAGPVPSVEGFRVLGGKKRAREEQAAEIEAGRGRQRRLWKWTCYMASEKVGGQGGESKYEAAVYASFSSNVSRMLPVCDTWESACWALFRSWLDAQVDLALAETHAAEGIVGPSPAPEELPGGAERRKAVSEAYKNASSVGGWPEPILEQQPESFPEVFDKLQTSAQLPEAVRRAGKEQQRTVQTLIILHEWGELVECLKQWIVTPAADASRPRSQPEFIRFAAHLVLALRKVLPLEEDFFQEDLQRTCNVIINMYAVQLVAERQEHLVALYAAQLVPYARVDLYANLLDMKQRDGLEVKQRIMEGALRELDFSGEGSVCEILDRVLSESRADTEAPDGLPLSEHLSSEAFRRTRALDWLFLPIPVQWAECRPELAAKALLHSNLLLRELALASSQDWSPVPPSAARAATGLLEHLSDAALPPSEELAAVRMVGAEALEAALQEKGEWERYFRCDGLLRRWALLEEENSRVGASQLSAEEALETRHVAEQALTEVREILDGWLSAESDALRPDGVASEEVEMSAALMGKDGELVPAGRAECDAVHDALLALLDEAAADGADIQVSVNPLPTTTGLLKLRVRQEILQNADTGDGVLVRLLAAAVNGDLPPPAHQLLLRPTRLDARYLFEGDADPIEAAALLRRLCQHCCVSSLTLRAMNVRIYLAGLEGLRIEDGSTDIVQLVATSPAVQLFSREQLQGVLQSEREATLRAMDRKE